jgi:uncharacterized lipoprotein YmbA
MKPNVIAHVSRQDSPTPAFRPAARFFLRGFQRHAFSGLAPILLAAGLCLLTACSIPLTTAQTDLTRYFLLTAAPAQREADAGAPLKRWIVGVRAVEIAPYLQTKSFTVRSHANEVSFLDSTRWGEPLDLGIARVLAEDLQPLKNMGRVSTQPFRADEQRDFEILVRVTACEGTADGEVRFSARWRILAPAAVVGTVAEGSYSAAGLRWDGGDYGQLAAKLSDALGGLSRDIAVALPKEPAGSPADSGHTGTPAKNDQGHPSYPSAAK